MGINLETRIERLETQTGITGGDGCAVCASLFNCETRVIEPSLDGEAAISDEQPPPCGACGSPREWLTIVIHDAETYAAQQAREGML